MVEVIWTDAAIKDLDDIGEYIAKDSQRYAEITVLKLFESVDILKQILVQAQLFLSLKRIISDN